MKTVLITGATAGFGAAMARQFAEAGWRVIGTGRRAERLLTMADELTGCELSRSDSLSLYCVSALSSTNVAIRRADSLNRGFGSLTKWSGPQIYLPPKTVQAR